MLKKIKEKINDFLCRIDIHYDVHENAYYMGEGWYPTEQCGQVRLCLWCGRIKKIGVVTVPYYYKSWQKQIRKGIHRWGRLE